MTRTRSALGSAVSAFVSQILTIAWAETRKPRRDPVELLTRAAQPVLWLGVFGVVMSRTRAIPTGTVPYLDFMVPRILAQSVLFVAIFSTFSLVIACLVKTRERFMGIGQVLTMPLFFASNAIYALGLMSHWLQLLSRGNLLTCHGDALRALMVHGGQSAMSLGIDFAVEATVLLLLIFVASRLYPTAIQSSHNRPP